MERQNILDDFANLINDWCEFQSIKQGIPREKMCAMAVKEFGNDITSSKIRLLVMPQFKEQYRIQNVKKRKQKSVEEKISGRIRKVLSDLGKDSIEASTSISKILYEGATFLHTEEKQNEKR